MFKINKTKGKHPPLVESGTLEDFFNRGVHSDADTPCLLNDTESNEHLFNRTLENNVFNILLLKFEYLKALTGWNWLVIVFFLTKKGGMSHWKCTRQTNSREVLAIYTCTVLYAINN